MIFSKIPFKIATIVLTLTVLMILPKMAEAKIVNYDHEGSYSIAADGVLYLNSSDAKVKITGTDRTDVAVTIHYKKRISGSYRVLKESDFSFDIQEENGNLYLREESGSVSIMGFVNVTREVYEITIEAPKTIDIRLVGEDDDYIIKHFSGGLDLRMEDGEARLTDMTGNRFEIEVEDGDVNLSGGSGMLDVDIEDGDFAAYDGDFDSISSRCEDGRIEIETKLHDDGNYRLRCDDGRISFSVLAGGGEFSAEFDDGRVRASSKFDLIDKDDDYRQYELKGGTADVDLRAEDGTIILKTK